MRNISHPRRVAASAAVVAAVALTGTTLASASAPAPSTTETQAPAPAPATSGTQTPVPVSAGQFKPTSPTAYEFGQTLATLEGQQLESTFMAAIIPHHRAAIEMAQLELERGQSPDIRTHAENIIANQQHQIDQFTRWLDEWYGLTPEEARAQAPEEARAEMETMDRETQAMVEELRQVPAGVDFDMAFVQMMVPHHQAGIIEFLEPQSRAVNPQLRVAATAGITTQEAQVADFITWLEGRTDQN